MNLLWRAGSGVAGNSFDAMVPRIQNGFYGSPPSPHVRQHKPFVLVLPWYKSPLPPFVKVNTYAPHPIPLAPVPRPAGLTEGVWGGRVILALDLEAHHHDRALISFSTSVRVRLGSRSVGKPTSRLIIPQEFPDSRDYFSKRERLGECSVSPQALGQRQI